jgi:hypothetical protein
MSSIDIVEVGRSPVRHASKTRSIPLSKSMPVQVYQIASGRYIFTDKYRGRSLSIDGFRTALLKYFDNGQTQRRDVLPQLIARLQSLSETIHSLARYRFYSGSLLIVYDGSLESNLIDVRMIDFAHTTSTSTDGDEPDQGYLHGLECLLGLFNEIFHEDQRNTVLNDSNVRSMYNASSIDV